MSARARHLVLVGLSFSGKSSVGIRAARRLRLPFVDTDREIERRSGMSVAELFREQGEATFRALEREVVASVLEAPPKVISTGGGAPMDLENRARLWDGNLVVYLDAEIETILARLRNSKRGEARPLLAEGDPWVRLLEMKAAREPVYAQAHVVLRTDGLSPAAVADRVRREYLARG